MKRKIISFSLLCFTLLFLLTGCGNKKVKTTEEFKSITSEYNYTAYDITDQYASYGHITHATAVQNSDKVQIEFYVLDEAANAVSMFNNNKQIFENLKGNTSTELSNNIGNYMSYALTSSGYYMYICQVDNTLLYAKVNEVYKEEIKKIVKDLGY